MKQVKQTVLMISVFFRPVLMLVGVDHLDLVGIGHQCVIVVLPCPIALLQHRENQKQKAKRSGRSFE
jgi:hypothetical protein